MPTQQSISIQVQPAEKHLIPGLKVVATFDVPTGKEFPSHVSGRLLAADKTVLCALEESRLLVSDMKLTVANQGHPTPMTSVQVAFFAPLSQVALEHIESQRKAAPHDVTLEVEIWGQVIAPTGGGLFTESRDLQAEPGRRAVSAITVVPDQKAGSWLLLQDGHQGFLRSQAFQLTGLQTVASSHWTQFFAPKLGLGTFMVMDLPMPTAPQGGSPDEGITAALRGLQAAQKELVAGGDDDKVIAALRPAAEALRARLPELKQLLKDDGYPDDAISTYQTVVENTFTLCSKFLHNTDKKQNLRPEVHAKHEDVQFVFTQMTTTLNLLLKKTARHNP